MAYVVVGNSSSQCSECGGNADPDDSRHFHGGPKSGWSEGSSLSDENGCGATFTERQLAYSHPEGFVEKVFNLTDMSRSFWKYKWPKEPEPIADALKHGQLAMVKVLDGDPVLACYRDWDNETDSDPSSAVPEDYISEAYWSFFGSDFTYRPEEVTVVKLVKVVDQ